MNIAKPKVTLLSFTPEARELLLFTKQTRLSMDAGLMDEIRAWSEEKKASELRYMLHTIKSSWEFVNYTFSIEGVSRAFTHQFVRTRSGHYAQQSQRTVDMEGFDFVTPTQWMDDSVCSIYKSSMGAINSMYASLKHLGMNPQDARGVLPTNIATNIIGSFNLRTLSEMARVRLCTRTQGEYQEVFRLMREEVVKIHAWAEPFIRVACAADGVCQFPEYKECPIKGGIFNPDTGRRWDEDYDEAIRQHTMPLTREQIQVLWTSTKFEAVPKQQGGRKA